MGVASMIFFILLAVMMVLLIRWTVRVFFSVPKPNTNSNTSTPARNAATRRPRNSDEARRTTIYTITADQRRNDPSSNFQDFFWDITPQTSRSRAEQLKDDKDLPSYEEVMQMDLRQQVVGAETLTPPAIITPTTNTTSAPPVTNDRVTSI